VLARCRWSSGPRREVQGRRPLMNGHEKSDSPGVPMKAPKNTGQPEAEGPEERGLAKGNLLRQNVLRTQSRPSAPGALERVRLATARDRKMRFTALLDHVYALPTLRAAYFSLKREAAAGVDGETWRHYAIVIFRPGRCKPGSTGERSGRRRSSQEGKQRAAATSPPINHPGKAMRIGWFSERECSPVADGRADYK
jgi:hypothetical protein